MDDSPQQAFLTQITAISKSYAEDESAAKLLNDLLISTVYYLQDMYVENPTAIQKKLYDEYSDLVINLREQTIDHKLKTHDRGMAIGKIINDLNYLGMPRIAAVEAVAKWLKIGKSTARTHNEKYRKAHANLTPEHTLTYSPYNSEIKGMLLKCRSFPFDHAKAKLALTKYTEALNKKPPFYSYRF